jgi:hypothetical protein
VAELIAHERAAIVWFTAVKTIVAARFNTTACQMGLQAGRTRSAGGGWSALRPGRHHRRLRDLHELQAAGPRQGHRGRAGRRRAGAGRADQQNLGGRVVRKAAGPDGTVDLEGTFIELRNSGGGGSYEDAAVLLCVRLSGKPGPQARVELADAPCPTNPTSRPPNFGSIDKIVTLS